VIDMPNLATARQIDRPLSGGGFCRVAPGLAQPGRTGRSIRSPLRFASTARDSGRGRFVSESGAPAFLHLSRVVD
jgi:hypothetical protein